MSHDEEKFRYCGTDQFLVVQDGFHPTPTSDFADLVLPAAIWGEKEGTYTNSERRISKANPVVPPLGDARPDFDIFLAIAEKLGVREELYPNWQTPHDAYHEWQRVSAGRMCDYSSFSWQQDMQIATSSYHSYNHGLVLTGRIMF